MVQMRHKQTYIIKSIPKSNKTKPRNRIMCLNQLPLFFTSQLTFKRAFVCVSVCVTDRPTDQPTNINTTSHLVSLLPHSLLSSLLFTCVFFSCYIFYANISGQIYGTYGTREFVFLLYKELRVRYELLITKTIYKYRTKK